MITPEFAVAHLNDPSEHVRAWTLQLLGEMKEALPGDMLRKFESMAVEDPSMVVRRYLASKLQRLPLAQRWGIAEGLIGHHNDQYDRNIPLLCWYGIEPLAEVDGARALALAEKTDWPQLREFIARPATVTEAGREGLMTSLASAESAESYAQRAGQLLTALSQLPPVERPEGWAEARAKGEKLGGKNPSVTDVIRRMGVRFGDADFFPHWRRVARNGEAQVADRIQAIELLRAGGDPELGALARELIDQRPLLGTAVKALRADPGAATAEALVGRLADFPLAMRNEAINLLAMRPEMALVLLKAVDEDKLAASLISPVMLDQFERFQNADITEIIDRNWTRGSGGVDLKQLTGTIQQWKGKLSDKVLAKADASRGRQVFTMTCGTCHTLFGQGIALGPDLTGSNRADLGYLLENVLAPSTVVGKDYLLNVFTMKDGSVVSGMVKEKSPDFIKVAMPGGTTTDVKLAEVESRQEIAQSLMPAGLFEALPLEQVADLVKYLASPVQVPMPGETAPVPASSSVPPPAGGVARIEGESLAVTGKASRGNVRAQPMTNFGPAWSGNSQLWWTGGKPGDTLTLTLKDVKSGTRQVAIFTTTAKDYAQMKVTVNGEIQEVDLFTPAVLPGNPIVFTKVPVSPTEPLKVVIEITGANPEAKPSYMVGIDRIEVK